MDFITDLKGLKALLKLCRDQGVTEIKLGQIEFKLGDLPREEQEVTEESENRFDNFPQGELTPEQLAFYSAGGDPSDDPLNQDH